MFALRAAIRTSGIFLPISQTETLKSKPKLRMNSRTCAVFGAVSLALGLASASATERYFTYTYEPETMPAGALEYEQ